MQIALIKVDAELIKKFDAHVKQKYACIAQHQFNKKKTRTGTARSIGEEWGVGGECSGQKYVECRITDTARKAIFIEVVAAHVSARVLSIAPRAYVNGLHALCPIRTPHPTCASHDA